jgi:HrpA-like RNA helicase
VRAVHTQGASKSVHNAVELLVTIGALTRESETLTPLGRHLASLPVDPRVGKMLVTASTLGCLSPALTIAAGKFIFISCMGN